MVSHDCTTAQWYMKLRFGRYTAQTNEHIHDYTATRQILCDPVNC